MGITTFVTTVYNYTALIFKHVGIYILFSAIAMSSILIRMFFGWIDTGLDLLMEAAAYPDTRTYNYSLLFFAPAFLFVHWARLFGTVIYFSLTFNIANTEDVIKPIRYVRKKAQELKDYILMEGDSIRPAEPKIRQRLIDLQKKLKNAQTAVDQAVQPSTSTQQQASDSETESSRGTGSDGGNSEAQTKPENTDQIIHEEDESQENQEQHHEHHEHHHHEHHGEQLHAY